MPKIGWKLPGLLSKNKKIKKNVRDPKVCIIFSLRGRRVVELNVLAEGRIARVPWSLWDSSTALQLH